MAPETQRDPPPAPQTTTWRCSDCCETFPSDGEPAECPSCGAGPTWIFEEEPE